MSAVIEKGHVIEVSLRFTVPKTSTQEDILRWAARRIGFDGHGRDEGNPLEGETFFVIEEPTLEETGLYLTVSAERIGTGDSTYRASYTFTEHPTHGACSIGEAISLCESKGEMEQETS